MGIESKLTGVAKKAALKKITTSWTMFLSRRSLIPLLRRAA